MPVAVVLVRRPQPRGFAFDLYRSRRFQCLSIKREHLNCRSGHQSNRSVRREGHAVRRTGDRGWSSNFAEYFRRRDREVEDRRGVGLWGLAAADDYCAAQAKFLESFTSPDPEYFAACGYGHRGRVILGRFWRFRVATISVGAIPFSRQFSRAVR